MSPTSPIPANTYRLQVTADFDLAEATRRLPYLHALGVDWVYLSPLLAAEPGSSHGYDVVDPGHVDESRGGAEGLAALSAEARRLGMGVLVDIVPNHVGVATPDANPWWWDVLRHGQDSPHAASFDIDWAFGDGRIRLPVLGDDDVPVDGGPVGNLEVVSDGLDEPELRYHDHRFPITPVVSTGSTTEDGSITEDGSTTEDPTAVHARQHYELVSWRRADSELNYRRFFSVNTLAGVRVEEPEVFAASHTEVSRWFSEGLVDGLRVDHPDGLRDPRGYLDDLATLTGGAYVLVEKILALRDDRSATSAGTVVVEELPQSWATAGTTGYDVLALIDRVLTDPAAQEPLDALESRLRGTPLDWHQLVHERKREVADGILRAETRRIVRELPDSVVEGGFDKLNHRDDKLNHRDDELNHREQLEDAVAEVLACFPVYRSYLPEGREDLDEAIEAARRTRPDLAPVLERLAPVLGDPGQPAALRFQQTSGMVMAKGVEDNSFYRASRLTSLNEVGGEPDIFAITATDFHQAMAVRQRDWPHAMTTLSTHDTKRGEDVRARITALAELPREWEQALDALLALVPLPDQGFAALLWQAVLGAWPAPVEGEPPADLRERLHGYAEKAMREAGDHTTWTDPDQAYEDAVHAAVDAAIDDRQVRGVLDGLLQRLAAAGWSNALAAKLVAITAPGVCDVYQGSELWEQSLVDPDNRRPVDFDHRERLLGELDAGGAVSRPTGLDDEGLAKLLVTRTALRLRRDRPELFTGYQPLVARGEAADHVLALDRGGAITVVTRLPIGLAARGGWGDTTLELPEGRWRNVLRGAAGFPGDEPEPGLHTPRNLGEEADSLHHLGNRSTVRLADLTTDLPVALLVKED